VRIRSRVVRPILTVAALALALTGCAMPFRHKAPTAPTPPPAAGAAADTTRATTTESAKHANGSPATHRTTNHTPVLADSISLSNQPVTPVEAMSPEERQRSMSRTVADTTAAGSAVRHCTGRTLQPDQEATADAVRSLLAQTRAALGSGELWRAESLARKARQLASSLDCP
jgi:hypothetical protein